MCKLVGVLGVEPKELVKGRNKGRSDEQQWGDARYTVRGMRKGKPDEL